MIIDWTIFPNMNSFIAAIDPLLFRYSVSSKDKGADVRDWKVGTVAGLESGEPPGVPLGVLGIVPFTPGVVPGAPLGEELEGDTAAWENVVGPAAGEEVGDVVEGAMHLIPL